MLEGSGQFITALICTRNRGNSLIGAVSSILASAHPSFEIVVVDQSTDGETAQALLPFLHDKRLRYVPQKAKGVGCARNLGLAEARGEIVAMTDDDCEVPPHWLVTMAGIFEDHPQVAVAFCNVDPVPYDRTAGFIPAYQRSGNKMLLSSRDKCTARGIGAGFAVRRSVVLSLGGFDAMLGTGGDFYGCEDGDIAVRALLRGYGVYETDAVSVQHAGFRTWEEGRSMARRDFFGIGAAYAKPLKCGYWRFLVVPAYEFGRHALWPPISDLLHLRRPRGLGRIGAFLKGFVRGWRTPVDPQTLLFLPGFVQE